MQFSIIPFILLGAATSVAGFHIPPNQPDGVYSVFVHDNGTEEHTRIGDIPTNVSSIDNVIQARNSRILPRQYGPTTVNCPTAEPGWLDRGDTDRCTAALEAQCGSGTLVRSGLDFYSIVNCVVTYFCVFGRFDAYCYAGLAHDTYWPAITRTCGSYYPGWGTYTGASTNGWQLWYSYGYENFCTAQGSNFCGRGTAG